MSWLAAALTRRDTWPMCDSEIRVAGPATEMAARATPV
jgi:hypothetical protein